MERYGVVPSRAAALYPRLPVPVREVLRLCDGTRTVEAIAASAAVPVAHIAPVIDRLVQLGVITARLPAEPRRRALTPRGVSWLEANAPAAPSFSDDEEKFFASPIDHLVED